MILTVIIYQSSLISATTGEDDTKTMIMEMKTTIAMLQEKITLLEVKKDPQYLFQCGYKEFKSYTSYDSPITYDSSFYSRTNLATGGLDLATGVFTSPFSGTYTVTFSLFANNYHGEFK